MEEATAERGKPKAGVARSWLALLIVLIAVATCLPTASEAAEFDEAAFQKFVGTYCSKCHGAEVQKSERRFDQLMLPARDADTLIDLQDMLDQLNLGEMPPAKSKHPSAAESRAAVEWLTRAIAEGHAQRASTGGQTVLRRLNRREYLNTIGDLLGLNMTMFDPTTRFPRDQTVEHMDNVGDALVTSGHLLAQYLEAADAAVEKALGSAEQPRVQTWKFDGPFPQQPELDFAQRQAFGSRYMCLYEPTSSVRHEGAYGPIRQFAQGVPADGYYEIRVKAEALNRRHPYDQRIFAMDPEAPFRLGVVPGNQEFGPLHHPQPIEPVLGEVTLSDDGPAWYDFKVWLDAGFTPRFTFPNGMIDGRRAFSQIVAKHRDLLPREHRNVKGIFLTRPVVLQHGKMPHIRIHEIEIRGPLYDEWPTAGRREILGDEPFTPDRTRELLEHFATRAYRRPVRTEEVDRVLAVVESRREQGAAPFAAFKDGLKTILCSPAFLYLEEGAAGETGATKLAPHALASRLSYFLWSTTPDAELTALADSGELLQPEVLLAQTRRLLSDPRSDEFITGFTDSWLNLRGLGDMPPDRDIFQRYYAEDLENAMRRETQLFMRNLIDENESVSRFLDCDYSFLNKPLAELYGVGDQVDSVGGHEFRRVSFNDPQRGGLLGQASVLTVTANGIETSPVTRGIWMLENILGTPPAPPPDDVPPIDPDVRGAKSIRDLLTKHRDTPACFECHRKIDPPGFALENFDPIGKWRTKYENGAAIDSAGELPGGQGFKDLAGLKKILVQRQDQFTRMLTKKLLGYACGRRIEPLDRPAIDAIVVKLEDGDDGLRRLIEQVVLSDAFRSK